MSGSCPLSPVKAQQQDGNRDTVRLYHLICSVRLWRPDVHPSPRQSHKAPLLLDYPCKCISFPFHFSNDSQANPAVTKVLWNFNRLPCIFFQRKMLFARVCLCRAPKTQNTIKDFAKSVSDLWRPAQISLLPGPFMPLAFFPLLFLVLASHSINYANQMGLRSVNTWRAKSADAL